MIEIKKTDAKNQDFVNLVKELDAFLTITDEDEHDFYDQYNKLDLIKHVLVFYDNNVPLACGALKKFDHNTWEIKRMFTKTEQRGKGYASKMLKELEKWGLELGAKTLILETGKRQTLAISLYHKNNYEIIDNYGQYVGVKNSVCFEKKL